MDAARADSALPPSPAESWWARATSDGRVFLYATWLCAALVAAMLVSSAIILSGDKETGDTLSPVAIALLLVANLIPAIALMVLVTRRIAMRRAESQGAGTGRLHSRLVALFSVIAAVPTVFVVIFASVLFQNGMEFWYSDRARTVLQQAENAAHIYELEHRNRLEADLQAMGADIVNAINAYGLESEDFKGVLIGQVLVRQVKEAAVLSINETGQFNNQAFVNLDNRDLERRFDPKKAMELEAGEVLAQIEQPDLIEGLVRLDPSAPIFFYVSRPVNADAIRSLAQTRDSAGEYQRTLARASTFQFRFNAALFFAALLLVGLAIFFALKMADWLVRPVAQLVSAAGRVEEGDFSVRVSVDRSSDEIATLGTAFNRMTGRLQEQTGALIAANDQLDTRRAFIEAVLSSVTAGVIALDTRRRILLINRSAETLLHHGDETLEGRDLEDVSPELTEFLLGEAREAAVIVRAESGQRTLAVKRMKTADGGVLTFDDITDQLSDQRSAAWSDIARRIAHEIKNPLTPIQLAAERLQRRYGKEIASDPETFERLTGTIVRQVGDLRRMVDEFSNFARMPKPVFREENIHDIARAALFLHEVAHPGVAFSIDPAAGPIALVCDRRQLGQALTNIVKNAVEAIEARRIRGEASSAGDRVDLSIRRDAEQVVIDITDTGVGLPENRERLTEPYMTTRVRGTGLGLAIVKKIVEEHLGEIAFLDRAGGGTHVRIAFDADRLAARAEADGGALSGAGDPDDSDYDEEPS
ncbi:MAG: ATP-binding protein [Pseudomonadota bacterium]|nr:ATP-binding protein [Pseudomonadota bacterium]